MVSGPMPDPGRLRTPGTRAKAGMQSPGDLGPMEYSELDDADRWLVAAREAFPDLDIYRVAYGYLAAPGGTDLYAAADPDALIAKLRSR